MAEGTSASLFHPKIEISLESEEIARFTDTRYSQLTFLWNRDNVTKYISKNYHTKYILRRISVELNISNMYDIQETDIYYALQHVEWIRISHFANADIHEGILKYCPKMKYLELFEDGIKTKDQCWNNAFSKKNYPRLKHFHIDQWTNFFERSNFEMPDYMRDTEDEDLLTFFEMNRQIDTLSANAIILERFKNQLINRGIKFQQVNLYLYRLNKYFGKLFEEFHSQHIFERIHLYVQEIKEEKKENFDYKLLTCIDLEKFCVPKLNDQLPLIPTLKEIYCEEATKLSVFKNNFNVLERIHFKKAEDINFIIQFLIKCPNLKHLRVDKFNSLCNRNLANKLKYCNECRKKNNACITNIYLPDEYHLEDKILRIIGLYLLIKLERKQSYDWNHMQIYGLHMYPLDSGNLNLIKKKTNFHSVQK